MIIKKMVTGRKWVRKTTFRTDAFIFDPVLEESIHKLTNNSTVNIARSHLYTHDSFWHIELFGDHKVGSEDEKVNSRARNVNSKNQFIKRYCF